MQKMTKFPKIAPLKTRDFTKMGKMGSIGKNYFLSKLALNPLVYQCQRVSEKNTLFSNPVEGRYF